MLIKEVTLSIYCQNLFLFFFSDVNMDEIVANSIFFFVGGYDTTVTALEWTLFALAYNSCVQTKLYDEICDSVLDKVRRFNFLSNDMINTMFQNDITFNNVDALEYLDSVINEALRMYPPATGFVIFSPIK